MQILTHFRGGNISLKVANEKSTEKTSKFICRRVDPNFVVKETAEYTNFNSHLYQQATSRMPSVYLIS